MKSSYNEQDVTMLIKDLTGIAKPVSLEERAKLVAEGAFERSIMIKEYPISKEYQDVVWDSMEKYGSQTAIAVMSLGTQLYKAKGKDLVLVSIIRAGIPIGILLKKWIKFRFGVDVPHYAISLVKGLDDNAMKYILRHHRNAKGIQFIDGWTGKGTVAKELIESAENYEGVDASLAVLSDAIGISKYCGIRRDFAVPSAPLNATATGLVSITVFGNDMVGDDDFHGAMYLEDLEPMDKSVDFINHIEDRFEELSKIFKFEDVDFEPAVLVDEITPVAEALGKDKKLLNPGINEAARAILRRDLEALLVSNKDDFDVQCISRLAEMKGVPVKEYPLRHYKAVSVAKN